MIKDSGTVNGDASANGTATSTTNGITAGGKNEDPGGGRKTGIRCVIATGSVDLNVRVFAS
jgi:platelet-activating factor acetylhydrolase IB subunit alpha